MAGSLKNSECSALCSRHDALESRTGTNEALGNIQVVRVHLEVMLRVGNGALEELDQGLRSALGSVLKDSHCGGGVLAADKIENDLNLARRDSDIFEICFCNFSFHSMSISFHLPLLEVLEPA